MKREKVVLKLPRSSGGVRYPQHPLIIGLRECGQSARHVAIKVLGVQQQTLHEWARVAREDRDFVLPARRALTLARFFGHPLHLYRPDIWGADDKGGAL